MLLHQNLYEQVQYVSGEHMTSYKGVTSFGRKAAILFSGYALNAREQRYLINCVFETDYKKKETLLRAESAYGNKKLRKRQSTSSMHAFYTTRKASMSTRAA